jgi:hypothetical protein
MKRWKQSEIETPAHMDAFEELPCREPLLWAQFKRAGKRIYFAITNLLNPCYIEYHPACRCRWRASISI